MSTVWQHIKVHRIREVPGLPGVRVEALVVRQDTRGSLYELFRVDEVRCKLRARGKRRIGHVPSAKGNSLFNACGIGKNELDSIIETRCLKRTKSPLAPLPAWTLALEII